VCAEKEWTVRMRRKMAGRRETQAEKVKNMVPQKRGNKSEHLLSHII